MTEEANISQGYKNSPLGIIPVEWEVKRLGEVCNISVGRDVQVDHFSEFMTDDYKYPVYSNTIEEKGLYGFYNYEEFTKGKVTVVGRGVGLGTSFARDNGFGAIGRLVVLTPKEKLSNHYLESYINNNVHFFVESAAIPQLTGEQIASYKIAIPSLSEQKEIEKYIQLWDTAIEKQSEFIEKLNLRKRALMQQLLTGKKRLPGFSGGILQRLGNYIFEWNVRNTIGCKRVLSVTNTRGFILQEEQFEKKVASNDTSSYKVVRKGDFAYNPSRVNVGSISMLNEYEEGILSPMYIVFKANNGIDKYYLLQCLQSYWFRGHIPAYTQGSVRDSLSFEGLCSMKFYIPSLEEQKAISDILMQADKEIELAKEKLSNLQSQKRGLMQQLLTGKKRIIK